MKIVSWNVNGIRSVDRKGMFIPMIEKLQPDILCLQETKAEQHQSPIDLIDYEEYWNSATKKGYSGTAIFTKVKPLSVTFDFSPAIIKKFHLEDTYGNLTEEGRVITLEYETFFVVTVYTPNAKDDLSRLAMRHAHWDPAFLEHVALLNETKPVIFCGDLNVAHTPDDLAHPKENEGNKGYTHEEREGIERIIQAGFIDTFRLFTDGNGHYTWWSHWARARERNVGWRIDYIFVNARLASEVKRAEIHADIQGSDHCPVSIDIEM